MSEPEDGPPASDLGPRPEPEPTASPAPDVAVPAPVATIDTGPVLPNAYDEAALREAVGAAPKRAQTEPSPYGRFDDDEPRERKSRRKTIVISAIVMLVGIAIATLVFLGRANSERFLITCSADHIDAR